MAAIRRSILKFDPGRKMNKYQEVQSFRPPSRDPRQISERSLVCENPPRRFLFAQMTIGLEECYERIRNDGGKNKNSCLENQSPNEEEFLPITGSILAGRYKVIAKVGEGQSSILVNAEDIFHPKKRHVAIKILHSSYQNLGPQEASCLLHLKKADMLKVANIAHILNFFTVGQHFCMVFEFLSPTPLYKYFQMFPFPSKVEKVNLIRKIAFQVTQCLAVLSSVNIIHADIKPENILFTNGDKNDIKIIDFGNAIYWIHDEMSLYFGSFELQTVFYRAPEVMFGLPFGPQIDMWSLGCVLAELYLGEPLFLATSKNEILEKMQALLGPFPMCPFQSGKYFSTFKKFVGQVKSVPGYSQNVVNILKKLGSTDYLFADFIAKLLTFDPGLRMSPFEAARHPFLAPECALGFLLPPGYWTQESSYSRILLTPSTYSHRPKIDEKIEKLHYSKLDLLRVGTRADDGLVGRADQADNVMKVLPFNYHDESSTGNDENVGEVTNDGNTEDESSSAVQRGKADRLCDNDTAIIFGVEPTENVGWNRPSARDDPRYSDFNESCSVLHTTKKIRFIPDPLKEHQKQNSCVLENRNSDKKRGKMDGKLSGKLYSVVNTTKRKQTIFVKKRRTSKISRRSGSETESCSSVSTDMPEDNSDSTKPCLTRGKSPAKSPALCPEVKRTSGNIADEKEIDDRISPTRETRMQRILKGTLTDVVVGEESPMISSETTCKDSPSEDRHEESTSDMASRTDRTVITKQGFQKGSANRKLNKINGATASSETVLTTSRKQSSAVNESLPAKLSSLDSFFDALSDDEADLVSSKTSESHTKSHRTKSFSGDKTRLIPKEQFILVTSTTKQHRPPVNFNDNRGIITPPKSSNIRSLNDGVPASKELLANESYCNGSESHSKVLSVKTKSVPDTPKSLPRKESVFDTPSSVVSSTGDLLPGGLSELKKATAHAEKKRVSSSAEVHDIFQLPFAENTQTSRGVPGRNKRSGKVRRSYESHEHALAKKILSGRNNQRVGEKVGRKSGDKSHNLKKFIYEKPDSCLPGETDILDIFPTDILTQDLIKQSRKRKLKYASTNSPGKINSMSCLGSLRDRQTVKVQRLAGHEFDDWLHQEEFTENKHEERLPKVGESLKKGEDDIAMRKESTKRSPENVQKSEGKTGQKERGTKQTTLNTKQTKDNARQKKENTKQRNKRTVKCQQSTNDGERYENPPPSISNDFQTFGEKEGNLGSCLTKNYPGSIKDVQLKRSEGLLLTGDSRKNKHESENRKDYVTWRRNSESDSPSSIGDIFRRKEQKSDSGGSSDDDYHVVKPKSAD